MDKHISCCMIALAFSASVATGFADARQERLPGHDLSTQDALDRSD